MMRSNGNTILIVGGTSGIGRALAEELHKRHNEIIVAGRRQELIDEITAANPGIHGMQVDLENEKAIELFSAKIRERYPKLNILFNNAGISKREDLTSGIADISVSRSIITTNIAGVLQMTAALLPTLRQQARATIITTSSGVAFLPVAAYPTYCASKAFIHSWLQSLRFQLRETSVEVLELIPPYVQTELTGPSNATDPNAMPLAEYVAEVMGFFDSSNPVGNEILVERVKPLRFAAENGYDKIFSAINSENH